VERVRCSRAALQAAPGRLGHHVSRHYDRGGRCIPGLGQAKAGNARADRVPRKPGLKLSLWDGIIPLVSVREHIESLESFVIQEWWPDSRRVTDVDGAEPRAL
jgi:hypothetical protein